MFVPTWSWSWAEWDPSLSCVQSFKKGRHDIFREMNEDEKLKFMYEERDILITYTSDR